LDVEVGAADLVVEEAAEGARVVVVPVNVEDVETGGAVDTAVAVADVIMVEVVSVPASVSGSGMNVVAPSSILVRVSEGKSSVLVAGSTVMGSTSVIEKSDSVWAYTARARTSEEATLRVDNFIADS